MFIKWTGKTDRNNAFGQFKAGVVYEVPDRIGKELMIVPLFVETDDKGTASVEDLAQGDTYLAGLLIRIDELELQVAELSAVVAAATPVGINEADMAAQVDHLQTAGVEDVTDGAAL